MFRLLFIFCLISSQVVLSQPTSNVTKIAFGSCAHEDHPLPIFNNIVESDPDLFIFLGDNIYGDTDDMVVLRSKYGMLGSKPSYIRLRQNIPVIATWDDHDYGQNDIGKYYKYKAESKAIFLDFFREPKDSDRYNHEGIYHSYYYQYEDKIVQVILLDGRTFRDNLKPYKGEFSSDKRYDFYRQDYAPHDHPRVNFLGEAQWEWLAKEFKKPADVRIIGTGTQFGIEWNGYEAWANFPNEQQRMLDLIKSTKANGVVFISGDVHYAELSKLETDFYPIFDFTASGLSSTWKFATPNKNRIEGPVMDNHFGMISIDWNQSPVLLNFETWDISGNQRIEYKVELDELKF